MGVVLFRFGKIKSLILGENLQHQESASRGDFGLIRRYHTANAGCSEGQDLGMSWE